MADSFNTMKIGKNNVFMMHIGCQPRITCFKKTRFSRWLGRDFLLRRATESKQTANMEVEIQMDDEFDNELFYYGVVCELFDETVEAEFSGFVEDDDDEVLEVESEDELHWLVLFVDQL